ncbi:MAG: serine/threonine protein kinase [Nannocystaceae bacterium]|nr:serine/threonine protein kinase [Nannocystaceae bacterium]
MSTLDEQRIAAYVGGELDPSQRAAVEAELDANPQWLAVVAVLARAARVDASAEGAPTSGTPAPGTEVGRYTLGELLGRGATGVVCAAWDPELRRHLAVKLVDPALLDDPARAQARLSREAKALARVEHRHVVRVFDVGLWRGRVFVAMEQLGGGTLDAWRREAAPSWRDVVRRWIDAGEGLAAAHAQGLVHRDFKPANVMLDDEGRVVVVDFGLAREVAGPSRPPTPDTTPHPHALPEFSDLTRTGASVGTPAYMPPEQHAGGNAEPASDQYAFCVSLYEALAGTLPSGVVRAPMPALTDRVPRSVWTALARGRAEEAAHRYEGMRPLLDALTRVVSKRSSRWPAVVALAVVGGGALLFRPSDDRCLGAPPVLPQGVVESIRKQSEPFAGDIADRVAEGTTRFSQAWSLQRSQACTAFATGSIDDAALDRTVLCLAAQQRRATTIIEALRDPDSRALRNVDKVVDLLPTTADCAKQGQAPMALSERRQLEVLLDDIAKLEMGRLLGGADGVAAAKTLVVRADELGHARMRASTRQQLGLEYETAGELLAAARLYREGAEIAMAAGIARQAARLLVRTAWVVGYGRGELEEGRRLVEHAKAWSKRGEPDAALDADRFSTLGFIELTAARTVEAEQAFASAYERAQAIPEGHPERDELIVAALNGLGSVNVTTQHLDVAREYLSRAAQLQADRVGHDHPTVAQIRNNVASLLRSEGRLEESREIFENNLEIFRDNYGEASPSTGATLVNLAVVNLDLGNGEAALSLAESSLRIATQVQGPHALATAKALALRGVAHHSLGRNERALADLREARSMMCSALGETHKEVGLLDETIGVTLLAMSRPDEALASYRSSLETLGKAWSEQDSRLGVVWLGRGRAEQSLAQFDDAGRSYAKAIALDGGCAQDAQTQLATLSGKGTAATP